MKLLAITPYYKPAYVYGGPVKCESVLFERLTGLGVDVTVITTDANGGERLNVPLLTPQNIGGVKVIYCPAHSAPGSSFYSPAQIKLAKQYILDADIVNLQTHWGYATPILSRYCIQHHTPYYITMHGQLMDYAMKRVSWIKRLKKALF